MEPPPAPSRWRDVAANASFVFYRPIRPEPDATWAGGFGYSNDAPNHIGIAALIRGAEVNVDTALPDRRLMSTGVEQRQRIADAIWHHLVGDDAVVELPATMRVESESRMIDVDGELIEFTGVRVDTSTRWSGSAMVGDTLVTITTTGPGTVSAIAPADIEVDENPPPNEQAG